MVNSILNIVHHMIGHDGTMIQVGRRLNNNAADSSRTGLFADQKREITDLI